MGSDAKPPPPTAIRLPVWVEPDFEDDRPALACRTCSCELQLHQPDPVAPARLLGICPACGEWYLVETFESRPGAAVASLTAGAIAFSAIGPGEATPGRDGSE